MSTILLNLSLLGIFIACLVIAYFFDSFSLIKRKDKDRGDYWTKVVFRLGIYITSFLVMIYSLRFFLDAYWRKGFHPFLDILANDAFDLGIGQRFYIALGFIISLWVLLLFIGLFEKPSDRNQGDFEWRWLAGNLGFTKKRYWVSWVFALPIAIIALLPIFEPNFARLKFANGYPAAIWGLLMTMVVSLLGVAFSQGKIRHFKEKSKEKEKIKRDDWALALKQRGIDLKTVLTLEKELIPESTTQLRSEMIEGKLKAVGADKIAPALIEVAKDILQLGESDKNSLQRLVVAPDHCGQIEIISLIAQILEQRYHAITVIITANGAETVTTQLQSWLLHPEEKRKVQHLTSTNHPSKAAIIWVVDAEVLSARLLSQLIADKELILRIGLIIWWHLQSYTGILGANIWAISRRLNRLLLKDGRSDIRTLVFIRHSSFGESQVNRFVDRLLPYNFTAKERVYIVLPRANAIQIHILQSHKRFFSASSQNSQQISERLRFLALTATKASVEAHWDTFLLVPDFISESELGDFMQLPVLDSALESHLATNIVKSGAEIRYLPVQDVLSLLDIVSQAGRMAQDLEKPIHHVGLVLPFNPYVNFLINNLDRNQNVELFQSSLRLICPEARPSVVRQHLLYALAEMPDIHPNIIRDFLWENESIQNTLDILAKDNGLDKKIVRYLDKAGHLQIDPQYSKRGPAPQDQQRPLDTIGHVLIKVIDPAGGDNAIKMYVDPERLLIKAYPGCVFVSKNKRYVIKEWDSIQEVLGKKQLFCSQDNLYRMSWRIRSYTLFNLKSINKSTIVSHEGGSFYKSIIEFSYEESIEGILLVQFNLTHTEKYDISKRFFDVPLSKAFKTRALLIEFEMEVREVELHSLVEALRHILPVHLGVEEDVLDVIVIDDYIEGRMVNGIGIVELYSEGIGLVDALHEDENLILQLFKSAKQWLQSCRCTSGCEKCIRPPQAEATNRDILPLRSAALVLLDKVYHQKV